MRGFELGISHRYELRDHRIEIWLHVRIIGDPPVLHDALLVDHEHGPLGEPDVPLPRVVLDAEGSCDLSTPVREQDKVGFERRSKSLLCEDRGHRYSDDVGAEPSDLGKVLSQLRQFSSSNLAEVKNIERHDHRTTTL